MVVWGSANNGVQGVIATALDDEVLATLLGEVDLISLSCTGSVISAVDVFGIVDNR